MATTDYQTQLENVQAAIAAIEDGGQSYSISTSTGSRSVSRSDLGTLYERESHLRKLVNREARGGARVTGGTPVNNA